MRISLIAVICLCISYGSYAQKFTVDFSEKIQSQSGIFKRGIYLKSLPADKEGILSLFVREKKAGILSRDPRAESYQVIKFNRDLGIAKEFEIDELRLKDASFIDFLKIGGRYYFFTQEYNKSDETITINATELNAGTMKAGSPTTIVTWDVSGDRSTRGFFSRPSADAFGVDLLLSADSSTFGFIYFPSVKRKETVVAKYIVLDESLKKLATSEFDFGVTDKKMELNTVLIDRKGRVYFNYDVFDDKDTKSFKRVNGEKVPAYSSHLLIMDGKSKNDIILDHENHFVKKIILGEDRANNVSVFAFYKNFYRGNYAGVAQASMSDLVSKKSIAFKFHEFPQELLDLVDHDRQGKDKGDNKGIDLEFEFRPVVVTGTNNFHVFMEFDRLRVVTNTSTNSRGVMTTQGRTFHRTFGDIIIATFAGNSAVTFTRLPKWQDHTYNEANAHFVNMGGRNQFFYSYETLLHKDKLLVFYNDDEDNITRDLSKRPDDMVRVKQSALACATINQKGLLEKREPVFSHRDMDGYMTSSKFYKLDPETYALFALNVGSFKYGTKIGKLTVK
jgi:hypothetical protein